MKENKIKTWVSFEPVINPSETLDLIKKVLSFIDVFKIGKLNHNKEIENKIDWTTFLYEIISILRKENKNFYIKSDLAKFDKDDVLTENEKDMDSLNIKGWETKTLFN